MFGSTAGKVVRSTMGDRISNKVFLGLVIKAEQNKSKAGQQASTRQEQKTLQRIFIQTIAATMDSENW